MVLVGRHVVFRRVEESLEIRVGVIVVEWHIVAGRGLLVMLLLLWLLLVVMVVDHSRVDGLVRRRRDMSRRLILEHGALMVCRQDGYVAWVGKGPEGQRCPSDCVLLLAFGCGRGCGQRFPVTGEHDAVCAGVGV